MTVFTDIKDNRSAQYCFYLLCTIALIFFVIRAAENSFHQGDAEDYFSTARMIIDGSYFKITSDPEFGAFETKRPFLYPLLVIFPGFFNDYILGVFHCLLGFLNIYLMIRLSRKLGITSFPILALITVLTPAVFIYMHVLMTEILVMTLVLLLALILQDPLTRKRIAWIQVILVLLVFSKPVFLFLVPLSLLFFIVYAFKIKKFYISILFPLLFVVGYMGFNKARTGYFHFSSMQSVNLVDYNLNLFITHQSGPEAAKAWRLDIILRSEQLPTLKEKQTFISAEVSKTIRQNFLSYSWFHFCGALRGMIDPGRTDIVSITGKHDPNGFLFKMSNTSFRNAIADFLRSGNAWMIAALILISTTALLKWFLMLRLLWKKKKFVNFRNAYLILFIGYYILITGPVNASRYMMPLQGVLIVFAIAGWENFRQKKTMQKTTA